MAVDSSSLLDSSPQSEADSSVAAGNQTSEATGDGYGSSTIAFGTVIVRVIPPKPGRYSRADGFIYDCAGTAHTVTFMPTLDQTVVVTDAAAGSATIKVANLPSAQESGAIAANDFIVTQNEDGVWVAYHVASLSGSTITVTVSVGDAGGSGLVTKVLADAPVYFLGAPGDHAKRQFTMVASTRNIVMPPKGAVCMGIGKNTPILCHSNNATATGVLTGPFYSHPRV